MSRFESFLAPQFEDYMLYRHNLGYDTDSLRWALKTVDRYLLCQHAGAGGFDTGIFPHPASRSAHPKQDDQPRDVHHPDVLSIPAAKRILPG